MLIWIIIVAAAVGVALIVFGSSRTGNPARAGAKAKRIILPAVILLLVVALGVGSVYQLQEDEYAVITTFGKPSVVSTSGLKFKIPLIQKKRNSADRAHSLRAKITAALICFRHLFQFKQMHVLPPISDSVPYAVLQSDTPACHRNGMHL